MPCMGCALSNMVLIEDGLGLLIVEVMNPEMFGDVLSLGEVNPIYPAWMAGCKCSEIVDSVVDDPVARVGVGDGGIES